MTITIYHNSKCGTSRNVIGLVEEAGHTPNVVEYLKVGWSKDQLQQIIKDAGVGAQDILRVKGTNAEELGLTKEGASDATIIEAMVADPVLVNRPIVVAPKGTKLCRPKEEVFSLL